jgi:hypothetical protein
MGTTTFSGPVNTQSVIGLNVYTVATAPDGVEGQIAYFSDGAAGSAILAFYDGVAATGKDATLVLQYQLANFNGGGNSPTTRSL